MSNAQLYYGSKISDNLAYSKPEGYLICMNVPIARTGTQEYREFEVFDDKSQWSDSSGSKIILLHRKPEDVFDPKTIASFAGKTVTDDHQWVTAVNYPNTMKGVVLNPRRGSGELEGYLVADLMIYDRDLADAIKNNIKREISCGYFSKIYIDANGNVCQGNIVGNHVAVVENGRAGHNVQIKDSKEELSFMKWFKKLFQDASPEEKKEILDELELKEVAKKEVTDERPEVYEIKETIRALEGKLAALEGHRPAPMADQDVISTSNTTPALGEPTLRQIADDIKGLKDELAQVKVEVAKDDDAALEELLGESAVLQDEELTEEEVKVVKDSARAVLKSICKVADQMPKAHAKAMKDNAVKMYGPIIQGKPTRNDYAKIAELTGRNKFADAKPVTRDTGSADLGKQWKEKYLGKGVK